MTEQSTSIVTYVIDKNNIIVEIGGAWREAAQKGNATDSLAIERVIGQPIENYVCSDVTQMYYDAVFKLCRLKQEILVRDYRCDSDHLKRFMRVTLTPFQDGRIELRHETLREEPFSNSVQVHEEKPSAPSVNTKRCSICNRLNLPDRQSEWLLPESIAQQGPVDLKVIHTVCPDCKAINWTTHHKHNRTSSPAH